MSWRHFVVVLKNKDDISNIYLEPSANLKFSNSLCKTFKGIRFLCFSCIVRAPHFLSLQLYILAEDKTCQLTLGNKEKSFVELNVCPFDPSQIFAGNAFWKGKAPLFEPVTKNSRHKQTRQLILGNKEKSFVVLIVCPFDPSQIFAGKAFLNGKTPLFEPTAENYCR